MIAFKHFWLRQLGAIRQGGARTLFSKIVYGSNFISKQMVIAAGIVVTAPVVLLIVCCKPWVIIRFVTLPSHRIGHFSSDTEAYLCAKDAHSLETPFFDVISVNSIISNRQLLIMWARTMRISSGGWLWQLLGRSCRFWTRTDSHGNPFGRSIGSHTDWINAPTAAPHLDFSTAELQRGEVLLKALGIPSGASWVCVHNRDGSYLEETFGIGPWFYHNFRDFSVDCFSLVAKELIGRGYYVVRMGKIVSERVDFEDKKFIDYAASELRSDFADMYLLSHCKFYLGSDAGLFAVAMIFRRPIAFVNYPVVGELLRSFYWNSTPFIIKRLRYIDTGKFIGLREQFLLGLGDEWSSAGYDAAGAELICATLDEVCDLAIEVDDRIAGRWVGTAEDEAVQRRFWHIMREVIPDFRGGVIHARIGAAFLRKHQYLLL